MVGMSNTYCPCLTSDFFRTSETTISFSASRSGEDL
uniref:Uncharacterized protein n=1 Tax=Rhizophora mucronata TaxID=61149 RepID=A0A2P2PGA7_RHIMU